MNTKLVQPTPQCDLARALKAELAHQQAVMQLCDTQMQLAQVKATLAQIARGQAQAEAEKIGKALNAARVDAPVVPVPPPVKSGPRPR